MKTNVGRVVLTGALSVLGLMFVTPAMAQKPTSYQDAKTVIDSIYRDYPVTTYCGCIYDGRRHDIDKKSCGLHVDKYRNRSSRLEWEHVMPAAYFGHMMTCWIDHPAGVSGRKHCEEVSSKFNEIEGDLVNLQPSDGALNAIRSNHPYGIIPGEKRQFGSCDFEDNGQIAEPPPWARGDIARTWFYMRRVYGIPISSHMTRMLQKWAKDDPPDEWERVRARRIGKIQGKKYTIHFDN